MLWVLLLSSRCQLIDAAAAYTDVELHFVR
jgi:hypothetical protein